LLLLRLEVSNISFQSLVSGRCFYSFLFYFQQGDPQYFSSGGVHHATRLALAAIVGLALGILFTRLEAHETFAVPALTILVVGFSLLIDNDMLRRIMHFVGVVLCWICVAHNFGGVFGEFMESYWLVVWNISYFPFHIWDVILPIDDFSYFLRW